MTDKTRLGERLGAGRPFRGDVSDIDLRLLKVFRTIVDQGGFQAAELALNKSASAISLDMSQLETRLGTRLCERGRGGFRLTETGETIYRLTCTFLGEVDRFAEQVSAATGEIGGRLSVLLVNNLMSVAEAPLVESFATFARTCPAVGLKVESAASADLERDVLEGRADLAISAVPRALEALELDRLFDESLYLYCGRDHPLFGRAASDLRLEEVLAYRIVRPSVMDDPAFVELTASAPPGPIAGDLDVRMALTLTGAYLGFFPPHFADRWVESGRLGIVLPDLIRTTNGFHLIARRGGSLSPAATILRDIFRNSFGRAGIADHRTGSFA